MAGDQYYVMGRCSAQKVSKLGQVRFRECKAVAEFRECDKIYCASLHGFAALRLRAQHIADFPRQRLQCERLLQECGSRIEHTLNDGVFRVTR